MGMEQEIFKDAETLSYRHNGVVLEQQREKLRKHASLGHAKLAGVEMPVKPRTPQRSIINLLLKREDTDGVVHRPSSVTDPVGRCTPSVSSLD